MKTTFRKNKRRVVARETMTGIARLGSRVLLMIRREVVFVAIPGLGGLVLVMDGTLVSHFLFSNSETLI